MSSPEGEGNFSIGESGGNAANLKHIAESKYWVGDQEITGEDKTKMIEEHRQGFVLPNKYDQENAREIFGKQWALCYRGESTRINEDGSRTPLSAYEVEVTGSNAADRKNIMQFQMDAAAAGYKSIIGPTSIPRSETNHTSTAIQFVLERPTSMNTTAPKSEQHSAPLQSPNA